MLDKLCRWLYRLPFRLCEPAYLHDTREPSCEPTCCEGRTLSEPCDCVLHQIVRGHHAPRHP